MTRVKLLCDVHSAQQHSCCAQRWPVNQIRNVLRTSWPVYSRKIVPAVMYIYKHLQHHPFTNTAAIPSTM